MSSHIVLLTCMRSFSSIVSSMLGQHPRLFALPEINPFFRETLGEGFEIMRDVRPRSLDGILRLIAELEFGRQTDRTVKVAAKWLWRRRNWTPRDLLDYIATCIEPRGWIEKSPSTVVTKHGLDLAYKFCPDAHFLHLTRHPQHACRSIDEITKTTRRRRAARNRKDAEASWYDANLRIVEFCADLPEDQYMTVRGEDILDDPERYLGQICEWLKLEFSPEILQMMEHPERSPFACIGPTSAPFGNDPNFLRSPTYERKKVAQKGLDEPLDWTPTKRCFTAETIALAQQLGYS